tara:strand:- start:863 stop:2014 length:1152 start_codon:yes stop_codon:yes gene_type:complete
MIKYLINTFFILLAFLINLKAEPKLDARTAILMDYNSGEILYEFNPDKEIYPASMTKIMTTIIVFDLLEQKKISLDDKFIVSEKAWRMSQSEYSSMFIMVNDQVSVDDLLKGIVIASGNDACIALAEGIAGTEENFVQMMNDKALEIGMTNTNFGNSSGIDGVTNISTVRDIAIMSKYLIKKHPNYYEMYKEKKYTWDRTGGDPITQYNRNTLLNKNLGVDGIKTGYLSLEKYSLASTMKRKDRRLIAVGSGFTTKKLRASESLKLLSWGFRNSETYEISKANETIFEVETWLGKKRIIPGITKENVFHTINKRDLKKFKVSLEYNGPILAPILKDQKIAEIKIYNGNEVIKKVPVFSNEKIEKINFISSLFTSLNYLVWGDV